MSIEKFTEKYNITDEKIYQLSKIFPEAFADGKINWTSLRESLGEFLEDEDGDHEVYGLFWPGKKKAQKIMLQQSSKTLKYCPGEGLNEHNTENIFIEGNNLEVLKIIREAYKQQVKLIYIDPPYNTGNDYVYCDDFSQTELDFLGAIKAVDDEGSKLQANPKTNGRFHSRWLSMMYSRLMIAKDLLKEDGVILISLDDNEQANLVLMCNEVFGEEKYVGMFPWRSRTAKADVPYGVSVDVEWVICYANDEFIAGRDGSRKYFSSDDIGDRWRLSDLTTNKTREERPNSYFTMVNPKNGVKYTASKTRTWCVTKDTFDDYYQKGKIVFPGDYDFLNIKKPAYRVFEEEDKEKARKKYGTDNVKMSISTYLPEKEVARTEDGSKEIREIFGSQVFTYPKPVGLIKYFIENISDPNALVMDFFAGSATTADAVLQMNEKDGGNRKFVIIQLPEMIDPEKNEQKTAANFCEENGLNLNIAELSKERIRRVISSIDPNNKKEIGFKVFKEDVSELAFAVAKGKVSPDLLTQDYKYQDKEKLLWNILISEGFPLCSDVRVVDEAKSTIYHISSDFTKTDLYVCLEEHLDIQSIQKLINDPQSYLVCLDSAITDSDKIALSDCGKIVTI